MRSESRDPRRITAGGEGSLWWSAREAEMARRMARQAGHQALRPLTLQTGHLPRVLWPVRCALLASPAQGTQRFELRLIFLPQSIHRPAMIPFSHRGRSGLQQEPARMYFAPL